MGWHYGCCGCGVWAGEYLRGVAAGPFAGNATDNVQRLAATQLAGGQTICSKLNANQLSANGFKVTYYIAEKMIASI